MKDLTLINLISQREVVMQFVSQKGWDQDTIIEWMQLFGTVTSLGDINGVDAYSFISNVDSNPQLFYFYNGEFGIMDRER